MKKKEKGNRRLLVAEILIVLFLLGIMAVIRFSYIHEYIPGLYGDMQYLQAARIQETPAAWNFSFGIEQLYVRLLNLVFWFAGNKEIAGMYLQAVLQIGALLCLYAAIRRISNLITASAALLGAMALPGFLWTLGELSPGNLLLLFVCLYLVFVTGLMRNAGGGKNRKAVLFLLTGMCCAVLTLLDSIGFVALIGTIFLLLSVKTQTQAKNPVLIQKKWFQILCFLTGVLALTVVLLWNPADFALPYLEYAKLHFGTNPWSLFTRWGFSSLLCLTVVLMCLFISIVKRIAFRGAEMKDMEETGKTEIQVMDIDSVPEEETQDTGSTRYIENPLPVPKRHVKKEMTYAFEPAEKQMCYDVEVSETDDFDIV